MSKIGQLVSNTLTTISANDLSGITSLRSGAFTKKTALTSVTLPSGITSIGGSAFSGCTGLPSITIPNSVTNIYSSAFSGCTGLTSITIPSSVTSIGDSTFYGCTNLSTANLPNTITSIPNNTFYNCSNLAIVIPSSVTTIGDYAYYQSCLAIPNYELFIPKSVYQIGRSCFIAKMSVSGQVCNNITSIIFEAGSTLTTIPMNCFQYQAKVTTLTLPSSLTTIGVYAFSDCSSLASITIPSAVTSIGNAAFQNTNSITEIRFLTPAGASITLPTAGQSAGMFYRKTAKSGVIVYTDNTTIKNYAWSSDNLTCTFKHLDGTDWT